VSNRVEALFMGKASLLTSDEGCSRKEVVKVSAFLGAEGICQIDAFPPAIYAHLHVPENVRWTRQRSG